MYTIMKIFPSYTFSDLLNMDYKQKELLYQLILIEYGTDDSNDDEDFIDLETATIEQIQQKIGAL